MSLPSLTRLHRNSSSSVARYHAAARVGDLATRRLGDSAAPPPRYSDVDVAPEVACAAVIVSSDLLHFAGSSDTHAVGVLVESRISPVVPAVTSAVPSRASAAPLTPPL